MYDHMSQRETRHVTILISTALPSQEGVVLAALGHTHLLQRPAPRSPAAIVILSGIPQLYPKQHKMETQNTSRQPAYHFGRMGLYMTTVHHLLA